MDTFFLLIGRSGVILLIGILFFFYIYKNSEKIFTWFEDQTYGTKDMILNKLDFLHIKVAENHIIYGLLFLVFGLPVIIFGIFAIMGNFLIGGILAIIFAIIGWKAPRPFFNYLCGKRITAYQAQMADALNLLTNGIRAGLSLPQAIGMVVDEMPAPISQEFNIILQQNKIGSSIDECFEDLVRRIPIEDNDMFTTSITILRETGGNLAETFDTIVGVIRERIRLQQKIDTYVAQGLIQGGTIFCMPTLMGIMQFFADPEMMKPMFTNPLGIIILLVAAGLNLTGGYVIMKIVKIKV